MSSNCAINVIKCAFLSSRIAGNGSDLFLASVLNKSAD